MKGLKMEQEADFSEPEQVKLVQPVVASDPAPVLPTSTSSPVSTSSHAVADKDVVADKEPTDKPMAKAPPSGAEKALQAFILS